MFLFFLLKDLRILLAERSTGFCLWEFKFDRLTQFENAEEMTVIRLTLNQAPTTSQQQPGYNQHQYTSSHLAPNLNHHHQHQNHHSLFSSVFHHSNTSSSSAAASASAANQYAPIVYHNEYFERFFNAAKNPRGFHKEHLIKFVIKRDCDEFCFKLSRIMNDKRNSDLFINESLDGVSSINNLTSLRTGAAATSKNSYYQSNQSLNSINSSQSNQTQMFGAQSKSSVIICHFDFFNYEFNHDANSLAASFTRKEKTPSLPDSRQIVSNSIYYDNSGGLGKSDIPNLLPKSAIKSSSRLIRQHSNSSANILPTPRPRSGLVRNESFRSNDTVLTADTTFDVYSMSTKVNKPEIKNLTGSVANLGAAVAGAETTTSRIKTLLVKYKKLKKSDISSPLNFNHVTHLDKPVPIGKRYKIDYC